MWLLDEETLKFGKIGVLVNFIIQDWRYCKIAQVFVSVTFMREILRELKKKIPQKPSLGPQKVELKYLVFFCAIPSSSQHEEYFS